MKIGIMGTEVYYESIGHGNRNVLLLHGWGCDTKLMRPVAETLGDDYCCTVIDFPGHGKSGRPPEPWGVPEYAACVEELMDLLGLKGCDVIAHSFGGRIAAFLEAKDGELFHKIILTGAAGIKKQTSGVESKRTQQYKRFKQLVQKLEKIPGTQKITGNLQEQLIQKYGSSDYAALDPEMRKTFVKVINQDLTECYGRFSSPTLLVWGKNDTETPLWMGQKMEQLIPDAGLVTLDGDHFVYLKQLGSFAVIIKRFLGEE